MPNVTPPISTSLGARTLELLALALRRLVRRDAALVTVPAFHWAEMRSIDFEGEDQSLTEADLEHLR